ncbi:MAG: hypothetical protein K6E59_06235 [Bacilli bacterium]|nr:hypothetical protein [Bacilli bacterium]
MILIRHNGFIECFCHPDLTLVVSSCGGSIYQIRYRGEKMLYAPDEQTFLHPNEEYFGQFVAPVAGRIVGGKADGFLLPCNEGNNSLHSGPFATCWKDFAVETKENDHSLEVIFTREDSLMGAKYRAESRYVLHDDAPCFDLVMTLEAIDPCLANVTNHMYFSLGEEAIDGIFIKARTPRVMKYGKGLEPLGFVTAEEALDLSEGCYLSQCFDHAFEVGGGHVSAISRKARLEMDTDASGIILYTDMPSKAKTGHSAGFTLETVAHPDMRNLLLRAGEKQCVRASYFFFPNGKNE